MYQILSKCYIGTNSSKYRPYMYHMYILVVWIWEKLIFDAPPLWPKYGKFWNVDYFDFGAKILIFWWSPPLNEPLYVCLSIPKNVHLNVTPLPVNECFIFADLCSVTFSKIKGTHWSISWNAWFFFKVYCRIESSI